MSTVDASVYVAVAAGTAAQLAKSCLHASVETEDEKIEANKRQAEW